MNTKGTMCRLVMKGSVVVRTHNETHDFSLQCDSFLHTPSMYLEWVHLSKNSRIVPWQLTYVKLYTRPNPWRTWFMKCSSITLYCSKTITILRIDSVPNFLEKFVFAM